ncbi:ribosome biogenesis protein SLX9 homolog isoform X2 [Eubalaena glacialis]|uniref:ribosome biogenesis protein SLX9 homolog isoform X2 n=1 Tax=Eubalaena glacialis TaxID=27606 RepID=UPI002A5A2F71|nr:ribosome biogenesis protein SLX9 homolog isoform X2 [Eubalaena glacialis]
MGKVRGLRSRVHKAAVRPTGEAAPGPAPPAREAASLQASAGGVGGKEWAFMNASVFAGTTIDPSALVQKLDVDARSIASVRRGAKAKAVLPKKEKLKLRRERWLQKIEATRLAEQKRTAARRRRATVVVGDLQPLRDALPELLELQTAGQRSSQLTAGTYVCVLTQLGKQASRWSSSPEVPPRAARAGVLFQPRHLCGHVGSGQCALSCSWSWQEGLCPLSTRLGRAARARPDAGGHQVPGSPAEPDERGAEVPAPRGGKDAVSGATGQPGLQSQPPAGHRAAAGPADAAGGWRAVLTRRGRA